MKIAVWHNLASGGGKRTLYNHVKILKENGYYIEIWTTDVFSQDYLPLSDISIEHKKELKNAYYDLWKIRNPIKRQSRITELLNAHCIECIKEIEAKKFDLLFVNSCGITYMPYIGKFTKLPRILYLGEPNRLLYEAFPENIWKAPYDELKLKKIKRIINDFKINYSRRIQVLNEIEAAKSYQKILVNSLFSRENIMRSYGLDSTVCYLGVDTEKFNRTEIKKEPYVVGVGTICFIKAIDKAIEIIGRIPLGIRPVLKWIANGFDKSYLDEMIELAKKAHVDFKYYINISDIELVNIVSKAAIMIYTPRLEPFGLAPLESNACGTYVVAIAEGGVRESISNGKNGTLINGYFVDELADIVSSFVKDLELAEARGNEARYFVQKYWDKRFMTDNIIKEIEDIVLKK